MFIHIEPKTKIKLDMFHWLRFSCDLEEMTRNYR